VKIVDQDRTEIKKAGRPKIPPENTHKFKQASVITTKHT
jgi:hypothetical protein